MSWSGGAATGIGVQAELAERLTISQVDASNRVRGVFLSIVEDSTIDHADVSGASNIGIYANGTSGNNTYSNNDVSGSSIGIALEGTIGNNTVESNNADNTFIGILSRNSAGNSYSANTLTNTGGFGLWIEDDNTFAVTGNNFTGSNDGITIRDSGGYTITPNATTWDVDLTPVSDIALELFNTQDVTIDGIDVSGSSGAGKGLQVIGGDSFEFRNIDASNRNRGIELTDVTNSVVEDVVATNSANIGIYARGNSGGNAYSDNNVSGSVIGLALEGAIGSNDLNGNNASNTVVGILGRNSVGNTYVGNDVSDADIGLWLEDDNDFVIVGNDFTGAADGIRILDASGFTIGPNPARWDVELSQVTDVGLELSSVSNATLDGVDFSFGGASPTGMGLLQIGGSNIDIHNMTISNRDIGFRLVNATNTTIECSSLLDNNQGGQAISGGSGLSITDSHFEGNGLALNTTTLMLADGNYWGAADGPANAGGSGDLYIGNVTVNSWLNSLPPCLFSNQAPELTADNATTSGNEGTSIANSGTWSDADAGDTVTLTASVGVVIRNADGTWDWTYSADDGPAESQTVVITADDGNGGVAEIDFAMTVANVAPSNVHISGPSTGLVGSELTFTLEADDASAADEAAGFTFEIDWDGNGSVDQTVNGLSGVTVDHTFTAGGTTTVLVNAIDKDGGVSAVAGSITIEVVQPVDVDVKPGNSQNKVNVKSQGVIPVAIYTTADFDAATVDGNTVQLAGVAASHFALEDVDGDGDLDMILHFDTQDVLDVLGVDLNSGESTTLNVELTGETIDEVMIQGFDTIEFFRPGKGRGRR